MNQLARIFIILLIGSSFLSLSFPTFQSAIPKKCLKKLCADPQNGLPSITVRGIGSSPDITVAQKIAMLNAQAALTEFVNVRIKTVTKQLVAQKQDRMNTQLTRTFEEEIYKLTDVSVFSNDYVVTCDKEIFCKKLWYVSTILEMNSTNFKDNLLDQIETVFAKESYSFCEEDIQLFESILEEETKEQELQIIETSIKE